MRGRLYLQVAEQRGGSDYGGQSQGRRSRSFGVPPSGQQKVSVPTVLQAYMVLENRRMIEAKPKRAFCKASSFRIPGRTGGVWQDLHGALGRFSSLHANRSRSRRSQSRASRRRHSESRPSSGRQAFPSWAAGPGAHSGDHQLRSRTRFPTLRREISRRSLDWGCHLSSATNS